MSGSSITEQLSSEQWHELYHYMGSRALQASEFFGRKLRKGRLSGQGRELILERMLNEVSWANTVVAIAQSTTSVQQMGIIRKLTRLLLSPHATADASSTGYTNLYESTPGLVAAFPVTRRVWWDFSTIKDEGSCLTSFDDVIAAYEQDRTYIHPDAASDFLYPPLPFDQTPDTALFQARQAGEAALGLVDHRLNEAKKSLRALQEKMEGDARIVFDDDTGVDRLSMYYMDAFTQPTFNTE